MGEGLLSVQRKPYSIGTIFQGISYNRVLFGCVLRKVLEQSLLSQIVKTFTHLLDDAVPSGNIH